jgi:hypothetical protein
MEDTRRYLTFKRVTLHAHNRHKFRELNYATSSSDCSTVKVKLKCCTLYKYLLEYVTRDVLGHFLLEAFMFCAFVV